jgi:hypothetical protein
MSGPRFYGTITVDEGLVPEYECFGICSIAWRPYIDGSLRSLIATGKGQPNPTE